MGGFLGDCLGRRWRKGSRMLPFMDFALVLRTVVLQHSMRVSGGFRWNSVDGPYHGVNSVLPVRMRVMIRLIRSAQRSDALERARRDISLRALVGSPCSGSVAGRRVLDGCVLH